MTLSGMNTTAGSYSLLGSIVPDDATIVKKFRSAGAIILGMSVLLPFFSNPIHRDIKKERPPCLNGHNIAETYHLAGQGEVASVQARISQARIHALLLLVLVLQHLSVLQL